MTLSILRKDMSATSRNDYTEIFKTSTIYMLEKVIETSSVKILSGYYHTNLGRGGQGGGCQENARNFSTLNQGVMHRLHTQVIFKVRVSSILEQ